MWVFITAYLTFAAVLALVGTNAQARLSRERLLIDADPLVAEAGRLWTPMRWLTRPSNRRRRADAEVKLRQDPARWRRYDRLCTELFAWNALETSVALAAVASVMACIATFAD